MGNPDRPNFYYKKIFRAKKNIFVDFNQLNVPTGISKTTAENHIFSMVKADFAGFNVKVTKSKPSKDFKHLIVTDMGGTCGGLLGITTMWGDVGRVYADNLFCNTTTQQQSSRLNTVGNTSSHEIGHMYGLGHTSSGIMQQGLKLNDRFWIKKSLDHLNKYIGY